MQTNPVSCLKPVLCLLLPIFFVIVLKAAPGGLDPTFGNGGKVVTSTNGFSTSGVVALAVQPDGKTVVAGDSANFFLIRYNPDGSPDNSFGTSGVVNTPFANGNPSSIRDLLVQPDGKIVAVGTTRINNLSSFAVARYNADGSFDNSFGTNGLYTMTFTTVPEASAILLKAAIQNDGKILAASGSRIIRLNPNGTLDTGFGTNGVYITPSLGLEGNLLSLPDRKILIITSVYFDDGRIGKALVRLDDKGVPDNTFGKGGSAVIFRNDEYFAARVLALQSDGKIIVAGNYQLSFGLARLYPYPLRTSRPSLLAVARFNNDGVLDTTFGTNGFSIFYSRKYDLETQAVVVQPNDKIVVCGTIYNLMNNRFLPQANWDTDIILARFGANGLFETDFGLNGLASTDFGSHQSEDGTVAGLQPDGKIIVGGKFIFTNTTSYFLLARYLDQ